MTKIAVVIPAGGPIWPVPLTDVDVKVLAADLDRVAVDAHRVTLDQLAGGHVILPKVPRAGDGGAVELAFSERAALMGAYAIDSMELTANVGDCDCLAAYLKLVNLAKRYVLGSGCTHKSHFAPLV